MLFCLSARDLEHLTDATRILLSPLDFSTVDDWRSAVTRQLKQLLAADSAGFLLPVTEGIALYSEEHDPAALARYPELTPPALSDGTPIWARSIELGVTTLREGYGNDYDAYLKTAYHNEFAAPNQAFDTLGAWCSLGGADASSAASLQFWHSHSARKCFGDRELRLLKHLLPSFQAGVQAQLAWKHYAADLLNTLDSLGEPALVGDLSGRVIHQTPALSALLHADPDGEQLRGAMLDLLAEVRPLAGSSAGRSRPPVVLRSAVTCTGQYRVRACLYGESLAGNGTLVVIALECLSPQTPSPEVLRAKYGLTPAEVRVALLLAQGKSNAEIAAALSVSPHTSKRHTEHVLLKLNAPSRAGVASIIIGTRSETP
jgi:DNA-binding CsgD family transcriptional regulator